MRTARCSSRLLGGGGVCPGWGVWVSARHPSWTEWQTPVKTLPCRNYVVDGNKNIGYFQRLLIKTSKHFSIDDLCKMCQYSLVYSKK